MNNENVVSSYRSFHDKTTGDYIKDYIPIVFSFCLICTPFMNKVDNERILNIVLLNIHPAIRLKMKIT